MGSYHFQTIDCRRHLNICFSLAQRENVTDMVLCSACGISAFGIETNWFWEDSREQWLLCCFISFYSCWCLSLFFWLCWETVRSLRRTWEREILWTSCKYRGRGKENFVENVLEDFTNTNFTEVCRSLPGEGNGQPLLLSMVISEVAPAWWVPAGEILQFHACWKFEAFPNLYLRLGVLDKNLRAKGINISPEMTAVTATLDRNNLKDANPSPLWAFF